MVPWGIESLCGAPSSVTSGIPDVYIRITKYLGWISEIIEPVTIISTQLGARIELNCQGSRNFSGCLFTDPSGRSKINSFSKRKRSASFKSKLSMCMRILKSITICIVIMC